MSWLTSWLPVLPPLPSLNISLPTSIQSRFLSFILRRLLGHLLKPGQLDASQIESQIGSGSVHVADLALDCTAVNEHLPGMPVALQHGTIGLVTARIPWPNPLTSTVGFSLKSLHLTFHIVPKPGRVAGHGSHLADSVASVAESFIHEELSTDQEATLRQSFQSELEASLRDGDLNVPGGLSGSSEDENASDMDPTGVSIFATMIEGLLARFEFDAEDTEITVVLPERISITLAIAELRYRTEDASPDTNASKSRSITISGVAVTAANLTSDLSSLSASTSTQPVSSSTTSTLETPRPSPSPSSSSSSLDEDVQMAMSQSLAFLPPRPVSPTSSVSSSMYQSALSVTPGTQEPDPFEPQSVPEQSSHCESLVLSFGKEPIVWRLVTPPPTSLLPGADEALRASVEAGVVACALRAWQIRGFIDIADALTPPSPKAPHTAESTLSLSADVSGKLKGIVMLFLPALSQAETEYSAHSLTAFFDKPLVPPHLSIGYLRLHIERPSLTGSLAFRPATGSVRSPSSTSRVSMSATVDEISIFVFSSSKPGAKDFHASPILITDPHLPSAYSLFHSHPDPIARTGECQDMPIFGILDWTNTDSRLNGMRVSQWRVKHKGNTSDIMHSLAAISVSFVQQTSLDKKKRESSTTDTVVSISPLHIFVDLRQLVNNHVLGFVEEVTRPRSDDRDGNLDLREADNSDSDEELDDAEQVPIIPQTMPSTRKRQSLELERRRLEKLVLKDLDLDYDYGLQESPVNRPKTAMRKSKTAAKITVSVPMLRLQVRCPPLPGSAPRSGSLILDVHDISISDGPSTRAGGIRFADDDCNEDVFASVQICRLLCATAGASETKAKAFLSLGPLAPGPDSTDVPSLNPSISALNDSSDSTKIMLAISVPSLYVNIDKPSLDALQYALDDASQLIEVSFGSSTQLDGSKLDSREASVIGSRFFSKSRSGSDITVGPHPHQATESDATLRVSISEVFVRLRIPEVPLESAPVTLSVNYKPVALNKPMDVYASDVVVQLKPDGKDETVIFVTMMDLTIKNGLRSGGSDTFLQLTAPRSLTKMPLPIIQLTFKSLVIPETSVKESWLNLRLTGFTFNFYSDIGWLQGLADFFKAPPGAFETVVPSECTRVVISVVDGSIAAFAPNYQGCLVVHVGDLEFGTTLIGGSPEFSCRLSVPSLALLMIDNKGDIDQLVGHATKNGSSFWKKQGFALLAEVEDFALNVIAKPADTRFTIDRIGLRLHLCADTGSALGAFIGDLVSAFQPSVADHEPKPRRAPVVVTERSTYGLASLDDNAFKRPPEIGPAPDMIYDDLPTNLDYLDESFGAAAGLRELRDDDLEDFDVEGDNSDIILAEDGEIGITSKVGGETIKMLRSEIAGVENYFDNLPPEPEEGSLQTHDTTLRVELGSANINVFLYDGYDWVKTRKTIEEGVKEIRKRLAKIRQLVASGQTQEPILEEETTTLLYNSVYIGLDQDVEGMDSGALLAAIDEELKDEFDTVSQSSWQSLKPSSSTARPHSKAPRIQGKRLTRAKSPNIEFRLLGMKLNVDQYIEGAPLVSKIFTTIRDLEILDHMKSSTWSKFLTSLRSDSRGNIRETDSNMARIELRNLHPVAGHSSVEARLRAKILPLRLHVDQDALDFLKRFFSFDDPHARPSAPKDPDDDIYFQFAEIFPVDLKLDYKPRRVDYRALKEGKTIELMNFFHFDGAEMTLRHITLAGISGWPRLFDLLNDLWTPDVKATQLVEVISGVAPIRSVVNVGSGIADLVLLPISQYKKDGRIVRGVQKGTTAFVKSTAIEAIKLGARLATGTQVILEQAEGVIGGQFENPVTAETLRYPELDELLTEGMDDADKFSKYAEQPADITEGVRSAYRSLHRNFNSAAQTILAVPMEVYERSGNEGPVRSVIRAVPIAVLRPMIGASEAVSKTLLGLHNTLDPGVKEDNQAKYKQR